MLVPTGHMNREHVIPRRLQYAVGDHGEADFISNKASTSCFRYTPQDSISFVYRSNHARPASPLQTVTESMKSDFEEDSVLPSYSSYGHCNYHPSLLDDPELIVGKHSTRIALLTFSSYMVKAVIFLYCFRDINKIFVSGYRLQLLIMSSHQISKKSSMISFVRNFPIYT